MRIRVGKNIFFKITVNRLNDEPEDFTDARNVKLTINRKYSSYQVSPPLTIHDNIIEFEFVGGGNATSGQYEIHLYYEKLNEASVTGIDKFYLDFCNAFILVDLTCKEDTGFESESPSINLKGIIERNRDGKDGVTPRIDPETKHWLIGFEDTGIVAEGKDGLTPYIGENGNWFIGDVDTGKPSRGKAFEYSDFTEEQIKELQEPARAMIDALDTLDKAVTANEQQRINNENTRVSSENARKESESLRKSAEDTRASNEEARKKAETGRASAEDNRVKAEQSRVESESNRVKAENTRVEKENERQTAENTRDTNEQSRKEAETNRVTAEEGRVTEFNRLKSESETATQNATEQADYAKQQGDNVAGTVNEIKTAQDELTTSINNLTTILNTQQGNRALYVAAGAVYNQNTGFYELNGLTDITEEQMREIYVQTNPTKRVADLCSVLNASSIRTNFPFLNRGGYKNIDCYAAFANCTNLEVVAFGARDRDNFFPSRIIYAFINCIKLREIKSVLNVTSLESYNNKFLNTFSACRALEKILILNLKDNISFPDSPLLSLESLQYLITNAANTSPITVTVHAGVYAKIQDETNAEWHALIETAAAKQITFATA
jgi:tetrahydromethanopterin S-methyltransferase subunit B